MCSPPPKCVYVCVRLCPLQGQVASLQQQVQVLTGQVTQLRASSDANSEVLTQKTALLDGKLVGWLADWLGSLLVALVCLCAAVGSYVTCCRRQAVLSSFMTANNLQVTATCVCLSC